MIVIKSNRNISRILKAKLQKAIGSTVYTRYNCIKLFFNNDRTDNVIEVLEQYKKQKFEIVTFTERQLTLTANKWGYKKSYSNEVQNLPLKHRFAWFIDNKEGIQSVTPITTKQLNNIIKIN